MPLQSALDSKLSDKPWGGVFDAGTDRRVEEFTQSVSFDQRLAALDIRGSIAHAHMLSTVGILSDDERHQIVEGLEEGEKVALADPSKPQEERS